MASEADPHLLGSKEPHKISVAIQHPSSQGQTSKVRSLNIVQSAYTWFNHVFGQVGPASLTACQSQFACDNDQCGDFSLCDHSQEGATAFSSRHYLKSESTLSCHKAHAWRLVSL